MRRSLPGFSPAVRHATVLATLGPDPADAGGTLVASSTARLYHRHPSASRGFGASRHYESLSGRQLNTSTGPFSLELQEHAVDYALVRDSRTDGLTARRHPATRECDREGRSTADMSGSRPARPQIRRMPEREASSADRPTLRDEQAAGPPAFHLVNAAP